jgi:hypothetical protein
VARHAVPGKPFPQKEKIIVELFHNVVLITTKKKAAFGLKAIADA